MADGGGMGPFGIQNWPYYKPPPKDNLGLKVMSSALERDTEPFLLNGGSFPIGFSRDSSWINNKDTSSNQPKFSNPFPPKSNYQFNPYEPNTSPILERHNSNPQDLLTVMRECQDIKEAIANLNKRSQGQAHKSPKLKKSKKEAITADESTQRKVGKKTEELVINGISFNLSEIPTPVCTCTGEPHQCYRWGVGGWQSACCTNSLSGYLLPMSMKRQGVRIEGRKMSLGAFRKVLEKLAGEEQNFSYPIDLMSYWAKHGTNKFVTMR